MRSGHFAFFLRKLNPGGAERVLINLMRGFVERGDRVDLLLAKRGGAWDARIPQGVKVVEIGEAGLLEAIPSLARLSSRHPRDILAALTPGNPRLLRSARRVARYLDRERPDGLLASLRSANIAAIWAGMLARHDCRVVIREANTMSAEQAGETKSFKRDYPRFVRNWFGQATHVIAVSDGVADDLATEAGIARDHITTVHNPVDADQVRAQAAEPLRDAWLRGEGGPLIVNVGRLVPQKNQALLVQALARVRESVDARLVLLGEGDERGALQAQIESLGLDGVVRMPGVVANPFAYMRASDVFVLSSDWEGFPNVLVEALACGARIVSTDCPSGPAEVLKGGEFGALVEMGNADALARAIVASLNEPPPIERQHDRAGDFSLARAVARYREILLGQ